MLNIFLGRLLLLLEGPKSHAIQKVLQDVRDLNCPVKNNFSSRSSNKK